MGIVHTVTAVHVVSMVVRLLEDWLYSGVLVQSLGAGRTLK